MTDRTLSRIRDAARQKPPARHSEAYAWLKRRHRQMRGILERYQPTWETIANEMKVDGVFGEAETAPTARAVRRIWQRVCRDVAEEEERRREASGGSRKKPNRSPRLTAPPPVVSASAPGVVRTTPAPLAQTSATRAQAPLTAAPEAEVELTPEARAELERLEQRLAKANAWAGPPLRGRS